MREPIDLCSFTKVGLDTAFGTVYNNIINMNRGMMMETQRTMYYQPAPLLPATLLVIDCKCRPRLIPLKGDMTFGRIYNGEMCDITVNSAITGRRHGEFVYDDSEGVYYYIDNNSLNGTFINGTKLQKYNERGSRAFRLTDGDILRVDRKTLEKPHPEAVIMIYCTSLRYDESWTVFDTRRLVNITIGRGDNNVIRLTDIAASREHAVLRRTPNGWTVFDNNSQNGISVNGRGVQGSAHVCDHDVIKLANTTIICFGDLLIYNNPNESTGNLVVQINRKTVDFGRKTLLSNIGFQVDSGDFVLILGGSGAGKTTLVKAILGDGKAEGRIILNGQNLYENFKSMKSQIGLVPQFLTLRLNDTVKDTLMDIADIKLDRKNYSKEDKLRRINDIMAKVGITNLQNHLISQLSGGQKKKVSVAYQLVGFQKVFICDEPDSGLDAASRTQQMEILREISANDKIVMVISHEPDDAINVDTGESLFTKVVVLAKSAKDNAGHLAFFGNVPDAMAHFGVNKLQDIMIEINPPYEGGKGRADFYIDKFMAMQRRPHYE